ncbi:hypothetical protein [uncultured Tessaracoccus sp.]|uniref:hypothetical protein n=1 Tax=uncultured Tessaracoccus sp. TaxID=905023 RepID=UPI00262E1E86|nr:hypothetical protein [uncultured Tessaracoccus sp.]
MLAGLIIATLLVVGLVCAVPWISSQRPNSDDIAEEPTERFSQSLRIFTGDDADYGDPAAVSTPLTRASERYGLKMAAQQAARRRLTVMAVLCAVAMLLAMLGGFGVVAWWAFLIPTVLMVAFIGVARFTVVQMHRRMDARAARIDAGFGDDEVTEVMEDIEERAESTEFSIDLTAPSEHGVFWDPVPVTSPTYVQKPLMPRTVRTIDLSAPVVTSTPLVPTADEPGAPVAEESAELPRAMGE